MHVVLLSNELTTDAGADEVDVLQQCRAVSQALGELGHRTTHLTCGLNLAELQNTLVALNPDVVFNLVEAVARTDRLMPLPTLLLEALGVPFTGSGSWAIQTSSGKLRAKRLMLSTGLPTPAWIEDSVTPLRQAPENPPTSGGHDRMIVKAVWEHASFGMDDGAVLSVDRSTPERVRQTILERTQASGRPHFAEAYIAGREFNLTMLAGSAGVEVMPPAEIRFVGFAPDQPRIVGFRAKWDETAPEYHNTPRTFEFPPSDADLLATLRQLALRCWDVFELRGYARVDFRVDDRGQPWILEVNINPCLSPDAGFAAALYEGGVRFTDAVARILAAV